MFDIPQNENVNEYWLQEGKTPAHPCPVLPSWPPVWLRKTACEPEKPEDSLTESTPSGVTPVTPDPAPTPDQEDADFWAEVDAEGWSEYCWSNVTDEARAYLTGPRKPVAPCPWCGGRLKHAESCNDLRLSWEPKLPFGRHKGLPLSQAPRSYLRWLATLAGLDVELLAAVELQLGVSHQSAEPPPPPPPVAAGVSSAGCCPRCGFTGPHVDVAIHNGDSVRRDCGSCRKFVSFPKWHGVDAASTP